MGARRTQSGERIIQILPPDRWECRFVSPDPDYADKKLPGGGRFSKTTYVPLVGWGLTESGRVVPLVAAPEGGEVHTPDDEIANGDPCTYRLFHPDLGGSGGRPGSRLREKCGECDRNRRVDTVDSDGHPVSAPCKGCHPDYVGLW